MYLILDTMERNPEIVQIRTTYRDDDHNTLPAKAQTSTALSFGNRLISTLSSSTQTIATNATAFFSSWWNSPTPAPEPVTYRGFMCGCGCSDESQVQVPTAPLSVEQPQVRTSTQPVSAQVPSSLSSTPMPTEERALQSQPMPEERTESVQMPTAQVQRSKNIRLISYRDVRYFNDEAFYNKSIPTQTLTRVPKPSEKFEKITASTHTADTNIVYFGRVMGNPHAGIHARFEEGFNEVEEELLALPISSASSSILPPSQPTNQTVQAERTVTPQQERPSLGALSPLPAPVSTSTQTRRTNNVVQAQFVRKVAARQPHFRPWLF